MKCKNCNHPKYAHTGTFCFVKREDICPCCFHEDFEK